MLKKFKFRIFLVFLIMGLTILSGFLTTLVSHIGSKNSTEILIKNIGQELSNHVLSKTINHLNPAYKISIFSKSILNEFVPIQNKKILFKYFVNVLNNYKQLDSIYYGDTSGNFYMLIRMADGSYSKKYVTNANKYIITKWFHSNSDYYKTFPNNTVKSDIGFDPRKRPWYIKATELNKAIWTDSYLFSSKKLPGISTAVPIYKNNNKKLLGVLGIDILFGELSYYLGTLRIGKSGKSFILDEQNNLIALSLKKTKNSNKFFNDFILKNIKNHKLNSITDIKKGIIYESFKYYNKNKLFKKENYYANLPIYFPFTKDDKKYYAMYVPFTINNIANWKFCVIISETDYSSNINKNTKIIVSISIFFILLVVTIGIFISQLLYKSINTEMILENYQKIDKIKDDFLSNTSIELQTPISGIVNIAESLIDGATEKLNNETNLNLNIIVSTGKRLINLITNILTFAKLRNMDIILYRKEIDIKQLVDIVLTLSKPIIFDKPITLENNIPDDLPTLFGDENKLELILHNLVENAIKFTKEGKISISAEQKKDHIEISINDSGIGIPQTKLKSIFNSYNNSKEFSYSYDMSCLGLTIAKNLVEIQGGKIWVKSTINKGSKFTFSIPVYVSSKIKKSTSNDLIDLSQMSPLISLDDFERRKVNISSINIERRVSLKDRRNNLFAKQLKNIKILAIDDENLNLQVLKNHFSLIGINIDTANSGLEALNKLKDNLPDIILIDTVMPRLNGFETVKLIRNKYSKEQLPVIFLTAKNQTRDLESVFLAGGNDYLVKPFSINELFSRTVLHITFKNVINESKELLLIKRDIDIAKNIQLATIPKTPPKIEGYEISASYHPMESIGGDFYDFHVIDNNNIGVLISDVSGHGISSALIASMIKIVFSIQKNIANNPNEFLTHMNSVLLNNIESQFLTANYIYIEKDKRKLFFSRAGHEPLIIFKRKINRIRRFIPSGKPIGIFDNIILGTEEIDIEPGDRIVLYTDGITESINENKTLYGKDQFEKIIFNNKDNSPEVFIDNLFKDLNTWIGKENHFEDDLTIVVIDIN